MAIEVYEWTLSAILAGQFVQTVQHVSVDRSAITTTFACARELNIELMQTGTLLTPFLDCLPEDYDATSSRIRRVSSGGGPTAIMLAADFALAEGSRTGNISSAQANPCLIFIGTTDPGKTGRLFVPGVSEDDIDEMQLVGPLVTAMQTFIDVLVVGGTINGTADTWQGCILRRNSMTGDVFDAGYVSPLIGTQRRRLRPV